MPGHRFYAPPSSGARTHLPGDRVRLSADESHHLLRVLRLSRGDEVQIFDGQGQEFLCLFVEVAGKQAIVEVRETLLDVVESPLSLTLVQALAKGEKFDLVVQKATELGIHRIVPLLAQRADVKWKEEPGSKRLERWQRIALEAAKQCGRRQLVEIAGPVMLDPFLRANARPENAMLFFYEGGGVSLSQAVARVTKQSAMTIFVGPEGGWSREEVESLVKHGAQAVTLGPRTLRTETAAIVAVTLVQHALGDLARGRSITEEEVCHPTRN